MAKVVLSSLVTSIRGKIGNGIASVWKGIQVIRQMPAVIANPVSGDQAFIRKLIVDARNTWQGLTNSNKDTWEEMALLIKEFPLAPGGVDRLVPNLGGAMSGFNCFVSFYMAAITAGHPAISGDAPLAEVRPNAPNGVNVGYVTPTATLTWTDPTVSAAGARLRIWVRSRMGIYHRQLVTTEALGVATAAVTQARSAKGANIPFTVPEAAGNERITVQMDTVNPSGFRSAGSNKARVTLV